MSEDPERIDSEPPDQPENAAKPPRFVKRIIEIYDDLLEEEDDTEPTRAHRRCPPRR